MQRTVHAPLQVCHLFIFILLKSDSSHLSFSLFHATACFLLRFSSLSKDVILFYFFHLLVSAALCRASFVWVSALSCHFALRVFGLSLTLLLKLNRGVKCRCSSVCQVAAKASLQKIIWKDKNTNIFIATGAFRCTSHQFGTSSKFSFSSKSPKLDPCIIVMPVPSRDTQSRLIFGTRACCGSPMTVWNIMGRWLRCYPRVSLFTLNLCSSLSLEQQCSSRLRHSAGQSIFD